MLPVLYFQPTVVCVDDDKLSINTYRTLFKDHFNCVFFDNGVDALNYLNKNRSSIANINLSSLVQDYDYNSSYETLLKLSIEPLLHFYSEVNKSNEIAVLLTDYYMEPMNGIELCQSIHKLPIKKFLLTEHQSLTLATNAYNNNIINYFLNKTDSPDLFIEGLNLLIFEYFKDISLSLKHYFEINQSPLTDQVFIDYFKKLFKSENIKEYYLIDNNGSYLLVNNLGHKKVLLVHTELSLNKFISNFEEIPGIQDSVDTIKNRTHIPFLGISENINFELVKSINNRLIPCSQLVGNSKYYLSLVDIND